MPLPTNILLYIIGIKHGTYGFIKKNGIGWDCVLQVLGNHEFDHGPEGLLPYLERLNAPMLGANVNTTFEPDLTPFVHNHVVLERRGRKIGIIGVLLRVVWRLFSILPK